MENHAFEYTYSAQRQQEVEQIRQAYLPKAEDKMDQLRKLHDGCHWYAGSGHRYEPVYDGFCCWRIGKFCNDYWHSGGACGNGANFHSLSNVQTDAAEGTDKDCAGDFTVIR